MSKRDELAAVIHAKGWPDPVALPLRPERCDTCVESLRIADAVLAWLGEQFDEGLRDAVARAILADDIAKGRAEDGWVWADREWLGDNADAAITAIRERLGLSGAAQDAQDGAVGPGGVRMGTGEGAAPNGAQIEDFKGDA
ncbi:MAG: hypothetical protein ACXVHX_34345 [Solirubrobacteraceae bacterium]